jgi:WD40 repeat protein
VAAVWVRRPEPRKDFFVSHVPADLPWAEWIAWNLEEAGYSTILSAWDYVVGSRWVSSLEDGLLASDRMVVVLSDAYLRDPRARAEWQFVYDADPMGLGRRLVPARVEDCRSASLLRQFVAVDLFGSTEAGTRAALLGAVEANRAGRAKPVQRPPLPGPPAPLFPGGPPAPVATAPAGGRVAPARRGAGVPTLVATGAGVPTLVATLEAHRLGVRALDFAPRGPLLVTVGHGRTAYLWDVSRPARPVRVARLDHSRDPKPRPLSSRGHASVHAILGAAFSPDARTVATAASDDRVILWDLGDPGQPRREALPDGHRRMARVVAFSPDGRLLATGGSDHSVLLWRLENGSPPQQVIRLEEHKDSVLVARFHPTAPILVSAGKDALVMFWDIADPVRPRLVAVRRDHRDSVRSVDITRDGRLLATASEDRTVLLWDLADPTKPRLIQAIMGARPNLAVAANPRGDRLATGGADHAVVLWDIRDPQRPVRAGRLDRHDAAVRAIAFNPDGALMATADRKGKVLLWRI